MFGVIAKSNPKMMLRTDPRLRVTGSMVLGP